LKSGQKNKSESNFGNSPKLQIMNNYIVGHPAHKFGITQLISDPSGPPN